VHSSDLIRCQLQLSVMKEVIGVSCRDVSEVLMQLVWIILFCCKSLPSPRRMISLSTTMNNCLPTMTENCLRTFHPLVVGELFSFSPSCPVLAGDRR
jgi:hypothetical protein